MIPLIRSSKTGKREGQKKKKKARPWGMRRLMEPLERRVRFPLRMLRSDPGCDGAFSMKVLSQSRE